MKQIICLLLVFVSVSCAKKAESEKESLVKVDTVSIKKVGSDENAHGCKPSAGYTWSELKKECVRIFEVGTRLDASQKDTMGAFVIFSEDRNKAELFTILEKSPLILERKSEGQPWINGDWQLITRKGYVLKKGNDILFTGK